MRSWLRMLKDLTWRPHVRRIRKPAQPHPGQEWSGPLAARQVKETLSKSSDIVFREFELQGQQPIPCLLVVVDGLVNKNLLDDYVLKVLMVHLPGEGALADLKPGNALDLVYRRLAPTLEIRKIRELGEAIDAILGGDAVLFFGDSHEALVFGARGWENRGVNEPESEAVVRGPREGFTETLRINTSLIRRKIRNPDLRILTLKLGSVTRTDIAVVYIEHIAKPELVAEVLARLSRIEMDAVLESAYIEEMIEDVPYTPFPQISHTERPDVFAARLLQGKVGILVDGSPITLMVPALFMQFLQVSEDYYEKAMIVILVRFIRFVGFAIALLAPSLYIAITTFHQEMIPTSLALSIAAGRDGVPVNALLEALAMTLVLEIVQEAGLRLPRPIGQTIGIVGAIVIGDASVKASLISPVMIVVVAITAIATYAIPFYDFAIAVRLLRFPMMFLAGSLGFFGLGLGLYGLLIHLLCMRSFGYPYLSPIAPLSIRALLQDTFVRSPWWALKRRPQLADAEDLGASRRQ